jgi:hypothetical protein
MNKRLSAEDRHAVDLLLERPEATQAHSLVDMVFAHPVRGPFEARLDAAEKVLGVLDNLPAPEPSQDLISRTMQRIEEANLEPTSKHAPTQRPTRGQTRHA